MKPAILYLAAAITAGLSVAPATAQTATDAPLTLEQDRILSELKDGALKKPFNNIAREAGITVPAEWPALIRMKPIADWTQGDFKKFNIAARRRNERIDELHALAFFKGILQDGAGDGGDGGD